MSRFDPEITVDGARNTIAEVNIVLDTKEGIEPTMLLDIAKAYRDPRTPPSTFRIDFVEYTLHKDVEVDLWWETTEGPRLIRHLEGRGKTEVESRAGIHNLADTKTGSVLISATGWQEGKPVVGSLTIHATKH
jgi:hypothetical protein